MQINYLETKSEAQINCSFCGLPVYRADVTRRTPTVAIAGVKPTEVMGPVTFNSNVDMVCARNPASDHSHAPKLT